MTDGQTYRCPECGGTECQRNPWSLVGETGPWCANCGTEMTVTTTEDFGGGA